MKVVVNGEVADLPAGATVADLVRDRRARERGSAVAVDGAVVPRSDWGRHVLVEGQTVELVTAVQGG